MPNLRSLLLISILSALALPLGAQDTAPDETTRPHFPLEVPKVDPATVPADYSIAGRWYSAFGFLDFEQEGSAFHGTYSCCGGAIDGVISKTQIDFTWKDPIYGEGWGYYQARENTKLTGVWGEKDDFGAAGTWNAIRVEEPPIVGDRQRFTVEASHPQFGSFEGFAVIGIRDGAVTGKLEGAFETEARGEHLYREEVFFPLEGTVEDGRLSLEWEDPRNGELGVVELRRDGDTWTGDWQAHRTDLRAPMSWTQAPAAPASSPSSE